MDREEFGRQRSVCGCDDCKVNCRHMPGMLVPADLDRMIPPTVNIYAWSEENLLASPGALAKKGELLFRIPTLVPAVKADGSCIHYTAEGRCAIHEAAPFGCAFFDCHSLPSSLDPLSNMGITAIFQAHCRQDTYALIWHHLDTTGHRQLEPNVLRRRMQEEIKAR